jgi:CHRD domain
MNSRRSLAVLAIAALVGCFAQAGAAQSQGKYRIRLSTVPMDGGMRDAVAGRGSASAVLAGTKLTITGTFDGLRSPATAARVHLGLATGVRGASLADLTVSKATSGMVSGTIDLTPEQLQSLQKGKLYVQISSEKAPDGNLWGWILK